MKQLRRLQEAQPESLYAKAGRGLLRDFTLSEADVETLQRKRPGLAVEEDRAVLIGQPFRRMIRLHYAFPDRDVFVHQFPDMFQRLLPAIDQEEAPLGFRFTLTERSTRAFLEPVLFAQAFELSREWIRMALHELPAEGAPDDDLAPGFSLRPARRDDAEAIAELDAAAFPTPALTPDVARGLVAEAPVLRMLEDASSGRAAGLLMLHTSAPGVGQVSDIAIHPDYQGRGLGEAVMRWALAWFRREGMRRARLSVSADNAPAIALYRKLGFKPSEFGLDYRRPVDDEEVRQVLEKNRAVHIRVRTRS